MRGWKFADWTWRWLRCTETKTQVVVVIRENVGMHDNSGSKGSLEVRRRKEQENAEASKANNAKRAWFMAGLYFSGVFEERVLLVTKYYYA